MTTPRLLLYAILLSIAGGLTTCSDHRFPDITPGSTTARLRVRTLTQETPNNLNKVSSFSYDGQGRLSLITAYQTPDSTVAPVENTVYVYDVQNRLTQVRRTVVRRGSESESYTYSYNGLGQVSQVSHAPSTFRVLPNYTAGNQASGYSRTIAVSGLSAIGGGSFTFTADNLTASTDNFRVSRLGGSPTAPPVYDRSIATTYTFDNKLNPFYGVFIIPAPGVVGPLPVSGSFGPYYTYYGGLDNPFNLSRNNVLSSVATGFTSSGPVSLTTTYQYEYNAENLPTLRRTTTNGSPVETLRFAYESY